MALQLPSWLIVALAAAAGIIALKFIGSILKKLFALIFIALVTAGIFGYLLYADASELNSRLSTSENVILFHDNGGYIGGYTGKGLFSDDSNPVIFSQAQLSAMNGKAYASILGSRYKLFIIDTKVFDGVDIFLIDDMTFSRAEFIGVLRSEDPREEFGKLLAEAHDGQIDGIDQFGDDAQLRGAMLDFMMGSVLEDRGIRFVLDGLKEGNIIIYPETIVFKVLRRIPPAYVEKLGIFS